MKRKSNTWRLAFCGVLGGFCTLLMLLGNLIPFGTYAVPCAASVLLIAAREECGARHSWALYLAVSFLSLILVADRELALFFVLLTGYYPLLEPRLRQIRPRLLRLLAKLSVYACAMALLYSLLLLVFPVDALLEEFGAMGKAGAALLALTGGAVFLVYDLALRRMELFYRIRIHPKIAGR